MHSEINLVVIAHVVGHGNHSPQAESLGYGHHSHPVKKKKSTLSTAANRYHICLPLAHINACTY